MNKYDLWNNLAKWTLLVLGFYLLVRYDLISIEWILQKMDYYIRAIIHKASFDFNF